MVVIMTKIYFTGIRESGACVYGCDVVMNEDYTMNQLVTYLKKLGYKAFMTNTMKKFVYI